MLKIIFTVFAYILTLGGVFANPITVSETFALKQRAESNTFAARAEWNALTFYLQGVIEGVASYQAISREKGKPSLFCPPKDKSFSVGEMLQYLEDSKPTENERSSASVIIEGYAREFPCSN